MGATCAGARRGEGISHTFCTAGACGGVLACPWLCSLLFHQQREAGPWLVAVLLGSQPGPTPSPSEREGFYWDVSGRTRLGQEAPGNEEALCLVVRRTKLSDEAVGSGLVFKVGTTTYVYSSHQWESDRFGVSSEMMALDTSGNMCSWGGRDVWGWKQGWGVHGWSLGRRFLCYWEFSGLPAWLLPGQVYFP